MRTVIGNPVILKEEGVRHCFCACIHMLRSMARIGADPDE